MAQRVHIILTDDLDNTVEADETVTFGLDGTTYEIDLTAANAARLRDALAPFVAKGRPIAGGRAKTTKRRRASANDATEIRAWARAKGLAVNDRGRVPADIRAAFEAAHA